MCYLAGDIARANGLTVALALWPRRTALPTRAHTKNNSRPLITRVDPKHAARPVLPPLQQPGITLSAP